MADSKRLLADALAGLMECKPLDQVRVAEIASAAGVSKQTFYHHFSDKYHLMECCFRDMFAAPFKRMGTLAPFDECYIEFLQLCHQRKTFLRNAFTSQDVNSLYRVMHRALRDAFGARVRVHGVLDEGETGFCLDFFSKGCAGCTRHWFDQGMDFDDAELVVGDLVLNQDTREVTRGGEQINLTATQFDLLRYLMENAKRVVSKSQILDNVWNYDFGGQANIVELYISYLRKKIDVGREPMIHTVRGAGYVLRPAV